MILSDIKSALFMLNNPVVRLGTKHMELDYHYVREYIAGKALRIMYIPSERQIKYPTSSQKHYQRSCSDGIGIVSI